VSEFKPVPSITVTSSGVSVLGNRSFNMAQHQRVL